jgi:Na+/serine symporter
MNFDVATYIFGITTGIVATVVVVGTIIGVVYAKTQSAAHEKLMR